MKPILSVLFIIIFFIPSVVYCGSAAPYTEEAKRKIENAQKNIKRPVYDKTLSVEERLKKRVKFFQAIFRKAGYDYSETIIKVVNDMKNNPQIFTQGKWFRIFYSVCQHTYDAVPMWAWKDKLLKTFSSTDQESNWMVNKEFGF